MMPSGTTMCLGDRCGVHFWGIHNHDSMWHLEIATVSFLSWPFIVPTYAGELLSGYNILMDYVIYIISYIGIPPIITLFKIIPVVWFVFYTSIAIHLALKIKKSALFVVLTLFLLYFADHFGYLIQLYHEGTIFKGSQSFSLQSLTSLLNTQFALSLPFIMAQLVMLIERKFTTKNAFIMGILTFIIIGLKFYGGVVSLIIAGFYIVESLYHDKKIIRSFKYSLIILGIACLSILFFYNPLAANDSGSVLTFSPFATVHSVIEAPDMLYMRDLVNARYFLYEHGWSPKLFYIELLSTFLYFCINFGTRIFGIAYLIGKILMRKASRFEVYILLTAFFAFVLNVMLIQKGDWWNTVQFGYYAIFLSNFLLSILLFDLITHVKKFVVVIAACIILLTIPSTIVTIKGFMSTSSTYISTAELKAMSELKKLPNGVVFNSFEAPNGYPFLDYRTSGYVSAFTGKQMYLAHLGPLNIIGVDASTRLSRVNTNDCTVFNEVDYIYYVKGHNDLILKTCKITIKQTFVNVYSNGEVTILGKK